MKILMCSSEVAPFAKTGGLADVLGTLPPELARRGHDVRIVTPLHGIIDRSKWDMGIAFQPLGVPLGFGQQWCSVLEARLPDSDVRVYFIEHEQYFGRSALYQWDGHDYNDNAERFAFFSRACLQVAKSVGFVPDVVHCHDWQTGLVPVYLKTWDSLHPMLAQAASVQSIHNIGYQGVFPKEQITHTQLGWEHFHPGSLEFYDKINYLKAGLVFADKVSTVSPTHAAEIQHPEHGWALDGVLRSRAADFVGILNGCDYGEWDPLTDPHLPAHFDIDHLEGKRTCKRALQESFGLEVREDVPIIGMVGRLAYQKGVDVLATAIHRLFDLDIQFVIIGSGEVWAHFFFGELPLRYPSRAGAFIGFDNPRAHLVTAGSDFFLMPSRYEPCGLSQMHALRYGTLPIVREVGGLVDTVAQYDEWTGEGDGFRFHDLTADAIINTIGWAVSTYFDRPNHILAMRRRAMAKRFDWTESAHQYEELYRWAIEKKRGEPYRG